MPEESESSQSRIYRKKWLVRAISGVTLVGLGINFLGEAIIAKGNPPPDAGLGHMAYWFWVGLFGLAALNAGICFLADAAKQRFWMEYFAKFEKKEESGDP